MAPRGPTQAIALEKDRREADWLLRLAAGRVTLGGSSLLKVLVPPHPIMRGTLALQNFRGREARAPQGSARWGIDDRSRLQKPAGHRLGTSERVDDHTTVRIAARSWQPGRGDSPGGVGGPGRPKRADGVVASGRSLRGFGSDLWG